MSNTSFSDKFDIKKEPLLKKQLEEGGFSFKAQDYAFWRAQSSTVNATLYKSGKILVQGKTTDEFVQKYLNKSLPNSKTVEKTQTPVQNYTSWIGTDESGKGDYFGPLVVAGVLVDSSNIKELYDLGIKDSKKMTDATIEKAAVKIKALCPHSVVTINPLKYNELYTKFKNLNTLLAWGHARAIENILEKKPCQNALSDKFGDEKLILNALMAKGRNIKLEQRVRAEEDIAVAAASVLARNEFVQRMKKLSDEFGVNLPKGASEKVKEQARKVIAKSGKEALKNVAKLHFKTTLEL